MLSEKKKYRSWTARRSSRSCSPGLRGDRSVAGGLPGARDLGDPVLQLARQAARGRLGGARGQGGAHRREGAASASRASSSGRWAARPTSSRSRGKHCEAGSERARRPVPRARRRRAIALAAVARVLQITRQAIYRVPRPGGRRTPPGGRPVDEVERAIVEVAEANPTDGYRLVTAWVGRKLGRAVNRKRVLRVMRERQADPAPHARAASAAGPGSSRSSGPASCGIST